MIVEVGSFRVSVVVDDSRAEVHGVDFATCEIPALGESAGVVRRAAVEVYRQVGGLPQLAMVGGSLGSPVTGGRFTVGISLSGATSGGSSYQGALGRQLIAGLPNEFGGAVLSGVLTGPTGPAMLTVDRGAHHPVESSGVAFSLAGSLLVAVLRCEPENVERCLRAKLGSL